MSVQPTFCPECGSKLIVEQAAGRSRPVCPGCGFVVYHNPVPSVGVLCEMEGGLVFVRRGHPPHEGKWVLPSGYIEADESSKQAAARECQEETGLEVDVLELFGVDSFQGDVLGSGIIIFYRVRPVGGHLQAGDDAAEARVFPLDQFPDPIPFRTHRDVIKRWILAQEMGPLLRAQGPAIRPARMEDEERILNLLYTIPGNRAFTPSDHEQVRRRFREKLGFEVLVAEVDGVVVGYLVLSLVSALSSLRAWIDDVVVDPAHQRQGLGAALVEAAIQQANLRGATHLFVNTSRGTPAVSEFYAACGFEKGAIAPLRIR